MEQQWLVLGYDFDFFLFLFCWEPLTFRGFSLSIFLFGEMKSDKLFLVWFSLAGNWLWLCLWWIPWVGIFLLLFVSCTPLVVLVLNFYWPFIFMSYSFVHGRLPYENLKPDPVMRSLLLSLPYRKVVSNLLPNGIIVPSKGQRCGCLLISYDLSFSFSFFLANRSSQMQTRFMQSKYLTSLDWKTVLKGLSALRPLIPFTRALFLMMKMTLSLWD